MRKRKLGRGGNEVIVKLSRQLSVSVSSPSVTLSRRKRNENIGDLEYGKKPRRIPWLSLQSGSLGEQTLYHD
ncbi:hypothetical protein J6590_097301 [Homalodisca vitripennis]|nr:hypothetical protein J6590_076823 [Homalodisca vitripennis]KAG8294691.1 hypothetical protein J6590_097301 [Homalodisca vitripennis]